MQSDCRSKCWHKASQSSADRSVAVAEKCTSGASLERKNSLVIEKMVGAGGFELPTSCSQSKCSTRLSYAPISITEMLSGVPEPIRQASNQHVHKARGNRTIKRLDLGAKRPWTRVRTLLLGWWPARCWRRPTGSERPICVWLVPRRLRTASQVSSTVQHDTVAAVPNFSSINSYDKIVRPLVAVKTDRLNYAEADVLLGTSSVCETRHGRRV